MRVYQLLTTTLTTTIACLLLLALVACGGSGDTTSSDDSDEPDEGGSSNFDQKGLISNVADIMTAGFSQLDQSAAALVTRVDTYCGALGTAEEQAGRDAAQAAFKVMMNDLQHSLLHSVGPALDQDRMLQLYSWPLTSACQIDQKLARNQLTLNNAVDKRGIDALEYLLFVDPAADDSCPADLVPVPADLLDNFNALSAAEKQARRCAFMQPVATDAAASTKILADAWDVNQGGFAATLKGTSNPSETLNTITDAMFYFEEVVKENKLDAPLGGGVTNTAPTCGAGQPCPEDLESPHARISKENVQANVLAFQALYQAGFDDWLKAEGKETLATRFGADIQAVIDGLDGISGSMFDTIGNDIESLNALLLGPVQDVSKALRAEILTPLGLRLPKGSESDTD